MDDLRLGVRSARCAFARGCDRSMSRHAPACPIADLAHGARHLDEMTVGVDSGCRDSARDRDRPHGSVARGDLDRLLNARHSELHELVARHFAEQLPEWVLQPEVSFAVYGERGIVDILAWHPRLRALLVIELKTDIADVNELVGTVDRKGRHAIRIAIDRRLDRPTGSAAFGTRSGSSSRAATRTRRRIQAHSAMLRAAFPGGRSGDRRLAATAGSIGPGALLLARFQPSDRLGAVSAPFAGFRRAADRVS